MAIVRVAMAKLNGVKPHKVQAGKVEAITYEGEVYTRVEGPAKVGDITLITSDYWIDSTKDAYYLTVELSGNDPRIVDDVGDTDSNFSGHYELFRNLTPITLEHDGVGYAKLVADAAPKAGDYVVFADADDNLPGYLTAGEPYEIKRTDDCGDAHITDDDGDNFDMDEADYYTYAYYAKVAAPKRRP